MGSLGWIGARGKSRLWVSKGFRREYHRAQAVELAIIDAAFEVCFCCVRDIPWILDSVELPIRRNKYQPSGIFNFEPGGTVYSRVDGLAAPNGMVGFAWNALREAFCGEQSGCLLALTYETLTSQPERAIAAVYDFIGEKPFAHDFQNVEFDAEEFDRRLGTPGLHSVGRRVESPGRKTVLPGDLWRKYENDAFWRDPARNPNQVKVI